jgi:AraC family transcriptional regulator
VHPRFEILTEKKLVGKRIEMSYSDNRTFELWRTFMPRRPEIQKESGSNLYSVEVYDQKFFDAFNPERKFEKWAAIEVAEFDKVPDGMETMILPRGLYAIFLHKGPASAGAKTYEYIFRNWLPNSDWVLDDRPHFALMGEKYKKEDPSSEEDIWIPIKSKNS